MDYEKIIHGFIDSFVEDKDAILIRELPSEHSRDIIILIVANPKDTARLIGRKGIIAEALREVISIAGKTINKRIFLKFESFESDNKDEE